MPSTPPSAHEGTSPGRPRPWRWRLRIETAIARSLFGGKHTRLPLKTKNRPVNIRLAREHASIVDQVARGKIVGAVGNDVELAKQLQRVGAGQFHIESPQVEERIDRRQFVGGRG